MSVSIPERGCSLKGPFPKRKVATLLKFLIQTGPSSFSSHPNGASSARSPGKFCLDTAHSTVASTILSSVAMMNRPFQNYDPSTKSFRPSLSNGPRNRASTGKRPDGIRSNLVSRPSPELGEQSVNFSDDGFQPSKQLSATACVIDLTRTHIVPPPEQYENPMMQNHIGDFSRQGCQVPQQF